jgi:hypothetical protein
MTAIVVQYRVERFSVSVCTAYKYLVPCRLKPNPRRQNYEGVWLDDVVDVDSVTSQKASVKENDRHSG